jgi:hypothetical protein
MNFKTIYRIYLFVLLIYWLVVSFTLIDSYSFWHLYPFEEEAIFDIGELLLYGIGPWFIYKLYQRLTN